MELPRSWLSINAVGMDNNSMRIGLVEEVRWAETTKRVYIDKEQYVHSIPPGAWNFYAAGYQLCHKWLKDRESTTLTYDTLAHYQRIVVALKETIRLMGELDVLILGLLALRARLRCWIGPNRR